MSKGDEGIEVTRFTIEPHPEGSTLIVERAESGNLSILSIFLGLFGLGFNRNAVVGRLAFMIKGGSFPLGSSYESGNLRIERDSRLARQLLR